MQNRGSNRIRHLMILAALALCVLALSSRYLWTGKLNTIALGHSLNDQVGYVTAARNLAETGKLESSLYYPALIKYYKSHNLLYMPGIYLIRAFFFRIFGYSLFIAFLPNLLAYVGSVVLTFIIADRLFDRKSAYMAAICLMLFPPFVLYSFTAMMETFFVMVCLLSFWVFISLPDRMRYVLGGLTIVIPFLVRESAALMLPGMAAMIFFEYREKRYQKVFVFAAVSFATVLLMKMIPFIKDIPPHFSLRFMNINALYTNAYSLGSVSPSYTDIVDMFLHSVGGNIILFMSMLSSWPDWGLDFTFFIIILSVFFIGAFITAANGPANKAFSYFVLITICAVLSILFSVSTYFINFNAVRQLLFMVPFLFSMISYALLSSTLFSRRTFAAVVLTLLLIPYGAFFFGGLQKFHNDFVEADRFAEQCNGFLDSLGVSKAGFFVAPHYISLDYVNTHYPIKWSFIPDNERTLRLLLGNYHVDLLILPLGHYLTYDPIQKGLRTVLGDDTFRLTGTGTFMDQTYLVYHRKDRQIPAGATSPK